MAGLLKQLDDVLFSIWEDLLVLEERAISVEKTIGAPGRKLIADVVKIREKVKALRDSEKKGGKHENNLRSNPESDGE